jgi:autophagy-related protein 17
MSELLTLVVTSKKALQQAESICMHTNAVSRRSSDLVVELLASEAKVNWLTESVNDQLNVRPITLVRHCGR